MARKSGIELRRADRARFNNKMKKLDKFVKPMQGFDMELKN